ncbi:unnamed protein product [Tilletia laevis]|nr:hypothetical protein A4X03_0g7359 [Tilletia caries]CAD6912222.1 unnamed protein product [Tilletia laevis]CAD6938424.1 unnamed protein product [Tilletia laevis]CAD6938783.1 unnamed protein product [Tilletia caries]CAD6945943.1 unnamed protein product [Tilletia caries]
MAPAISPFTLDPSAHGAGLHNLTFGHGLQLVPLPSANSFVRPPAFGGSGKHPSHSALNTGLPSLFLFVAFVLHGCLLPYAFLVLRQKSGLCDFWKWMAAICTLCSTIACGIWLHLCWLLAVSDSPQQLLFGDQHEYSTILLLYVAQEFGAKVLMTHFARHFFREQQPENNRTYNVLFWAVAPSSVGADLILRLVSVVLMYTGSQVTASRVFAAANLLSFFVLSAYAICFISALQGTKHQEAKAPLADRIAGHTTLLRQASQPYQLDLSPHPDVISNEPPNVSNQSNPLQRPRLVKVGRPRPRHSPIEIHYPSLTPIVMSTTLATAGGGGSRQSFPTLKGDVSSSDFTHPQPATPSRYTLATSTRRVDRLGESPRTPVRRAIRTVHGPFSLGIRSHDNDDGGKKSVSVHTLLCWLLALCCLQASFSAVIAAFSLAMTITSGAAASCYALMATIDVLAVVVALDVNRRSAGLVQEHPFDFLHLVRSSTNDKPSVDHQKEDKQETRSTMTFQHTPLHPKKPNAKDTFNIPMSAPPSQHASPEWTRTSNVPRLKSATLEDSEDDDGGGYLDVRPDTPAPKSHTWLTSIAPSTALGEGSKSCSQPRAHDTREEDREKEAKDE